MIKGVLLDIAGVLYTGDEAIPGAAEAIARLRAAGLPLRLLTNTTRKNRRQILDLLASLSFDISKDELFTPAAAACDWLAENGYSPHLLIHPALTEDFTSCSKDGPEAVVLGDAGEGFTYEALNAAFRKLANGAPLLALARNRFFKDDDGELSLDMGPFVELLEYASGAKAMVFGKPSADFFHAAAASMKCSPAETVMVGDDAESDVAGARSAGIGKGILVKTGKYRDRDEMRFEPHPTALANDISEAVDMILKEAAR